jgi:hypothetical protein
MGEIFFYHQKKHCQTRQKSIEFTIFGITSLFFIDPFNTILDGFGYKEKVKTLMNIASVGFDPNSNKTIWGINFSASF